MQKALEKITQRVVDLLARSNRKAAAGAFLFSDSEGPNERHFPLALDRNHPPMLASREIELDGVQMFVVDSWWSHFDSEIGHARSKDLIESVDCRVDLAMQFFCLVVRPQHGLRMRRFALRQIMGDRFDPIVQVQWILPRRGRALVQLGGT